eukprot:ctg_1869.g403
MPRRCTAWSTPEEETGRGMCACPIEETEARWKRAGNSRRLYEWLWELSATNSRYIIATGKGRASNAVEPHRWVSQPTRVTLHLFVVGLLWWHSHAGMHGGKRLSDAGRLQSSGTARVGGRSRWERAVAQFSDANQWGSLFIRSHRVRPPFVGDASRSPHAAPTISRPLRNARGAPVGSGELLELRAATHTRDARPDCAPGPLHLCALRTGATDAARVGGLFRRLPTAALVPSGRGAFAIAPQRTATGTASGHFPTTTAGRRGPAGGCHRARRGPAGVRAGQCCPGHSAHTAPAGQVHARGAWHLARRRTRGDRHAASTASRLFTRGDGVSGGDGRGERGAGTPAGTAEHQRRQDARRV